ncbi:hypothetical protein J7E93_02365 [Streptomyces sp. ISL-36]|uniref:hypothetical protein n=1 Tax=Streptomyces sp. ISL-36 TaxID=2819182 RepID=UPI001BE8D852|nr:hypothetical protein [Streptomyces sp. ISL-36]MBT2438988.1 hypothetical protein [Streptomyces sp. ISL-36]
MYGVSGTGSVVGEEMGARAARTRALAVLRVRGRAFAVALLPAAAAVILYAGGVSGHLTGPGWDAARWVTTVLALVVLLAAAAVALVVARARPAVTPTVELAETAAPDLYRMVRDLADRLGVPAPSAIALTPDCDSWLEDRTHPAHDRTGTAGLRRSAEAPVLVIGSPFLWWMRVGELRAVLAPVVAGTAPAAHPDIAAARRFVQGLDAAVAVPRRPGLDPVSRLGAHGVGRVARVLLRGCRGHAVEMERGVAVAGSERAQAVDYGVRIVAQEQVGLAYAGWDRLLTRVALPAWRMGRWPSRLDAGVVSALTELSRRDRLAEGFTSRLGERPACDLLEEPGAVDEATSLLAARLFHGGPAEAGPAWSPVDWSQYPEEVVDRKWRADAARLHQVLDELGVLPTGNGHGNGYGDGDSTGTGTGTDSSGAAADGPTLARVMAHLSVTGKAGRPGMPAGQPEQPGRPASMAPDPANPFAPDGAPHAEGAPHADGAPHAEGAPHADGAPHAEAPSGQAPHPAADSLAAALTAHVAREEAAKPAPPMGGPHGAALSVADADQLPLFPLQPPRTGRDLLADHVTAMVCCAAVDTAGAAPGLDWLDGPALLIGGERNTDLTARVLALVEDGDAEPLRAWLAETGVRPEKPVRLV